MSDKQQTALQQLIEKWEREKASFIPNAPIFQCFIDDAKEMLPNEKEQIIDAYKADLYPCSDEDAEQYYNETFKND